MTGFSFTPEFRDKDCVDNKAQKVGTAGNGGSFCFISVFRFLNRSVAYMGTKQAKSRPGSLTDTTNSPLDTWDFTDEVIWLTQVDTPPVFNAFGVQPSDDQEPDDTTDSDGDGTPDSNENASPNNGDANSDGTPDAEQPNVISYINPVTDNYAVFETDCASIENFLVTAESTVNPDDDFDYPMGLAEFDLVCDEGATATITQYYYDVLGNEAYTVRKWSNGSYRQIPGAILMDAVASGTPRLQVSYQITDGGEFDDDGEVNGRIVDPSGAALPQVQLGSQSPQDSDQDSNILASTGVNSRNISLVALIIAALSVTTVLTYRKSTDTL